MKRSAIRWISAQLISGNPPHIHPDVKGAALEYHMDILQDINTPKALDFNRWQTWRRDYGRRPKVATDGFTTSSGLEFDLWQKTMAAVHAVPSNLPVGTGDTRYRFDY